MSIFYTLTLIIGLVASGFLAFTGLVLLVEFLAQKTGKITRRKQ